MMRVSATTPIEVALPELALAALLAVTRIPAGGLGTGVTTGDARAAAAVGLVSVVTLAMEALKVALPIWALAAASPEAAWAVPRLSTWTLTTRLSLLSLELRP